MDYSKKKKKQERDINRKKKYANHTMLTPQRAEDLCGV